MLPTIGDYYRGVLPALEQEVHGADDARALGMDAEEWAAYLVRKYGMDVIEFDPNREVEAVEVSTTTRYGHQGFRLDVPLIPSDTLEVIFTHGLVGQPFYPWDYKKMFQYDHLRGLVSTVVEQTDPAIKDGERKIREYINQLNTAIEQENKSFPERVRQLVARKQQAVKSKHERLDSLAKVVGVKIVKQTDVSRVVPTAVTVGREVAALIPPTPRKQPERTVLDHEKFDAIMDVIDQQCRQFERTPGSFNVLTEEGLRDVMLSSLNAVFRGAATGETFQGLGKVDIHLRISEGEVFVAELKFWDGLASLSQVVQQVRERLTWRDAYGVAIILSRNADFGGVLRSVAEGVYQLCRGSPKETSGGSQRTVSRFASHCPATCRSWSKSTSSRTTCTLRGGRHDQLADVHPK
jgi:hypothetical protein